MAQRRYKKRRLRNKRKNTKKLLTIVGTGLLVVILVAAVIMNRAMKSIVDHAAKEMKTEDTQSQPLHPRLVPLMNISEVYGSPEALTAPPERSLPDTVMVLLGIDVNADGVKESLVAVVSDREIMLDRNLRNAGYNTVVKSFVINKEGIAVLRVDEYAMRDRMNRIIINQVPAPHGYAFMVEEYHDFDSPFETEVHIFNLVIIDEFGRSISDEVTIYWKPSINSFSATNTFGAPGTY